MSTQIMHGTVKSQSLIRVTPSDSKHRRISHLIPLQIQPPTAPYSLFTYYTNDADALRTTLSSHRRTHSNIAQLAGITHTKESSMRKVQSCRMSPLP